MMKNKNNEERKRFNLRLSQETFDWLTELQKEKKCSINQVVQDCFDAMRLEQPKVRIKDYEKEVHYLLLSLQGVGISLDYITADLIYYTIQRLQEKGGDMSLMDNAELQVSHKTKWKLYFERLKMQDKSKELFSEDLKDKIKEEEVSGKKRFNGFYFYNLLSFENQILWLSNFENKLPKSADTKDEIEVFLNDYFNNLRDFLSDSFSWVETEQGVDYWKYVSLSS